MNLLKEQFWFLSHKNKWLPFITGILAFCALTVILYHVLILIVVILHCKTKKIRTSREIKSQNLFKAVAFNCLLSLLLAVPFCLSNISYLSNQNIASAFARYILTAALDYDFLGIAYDCEKISSFYINMICMALTYVSASVSMRICWLLYQPLTFLIVLFADSDIRHIFWNIAPLVFCTHVLKRICPKYSVDREGPRNNLPNAETHQIELLSYVKLITN